AGHQPFDAGDEPVVLAVVPLQVRAVPALRRVVLDLFGAGQVVRRDRGAVTPRVGRVRAVRQAVATVLQRAQVVVVGVVLHHEHHDVLDLRQQIRAFGEVGPGPLAGPLGRDTAPAG